MKKTKKIIFNVLLASPLFATIPWVTASSKSPSNNFSIDATTGKQTGIVSTESLSALNSSIKAYSPSTINEQQSSPNDDIKNFLVESLSNKPADFNSSNIKSIKVSDFDDINGTVIITAIQVNSWNNRYGVVTKTNSWIYGYIRIIDLVKHPITEINSFDVSSSHANTDPTSLSKDEATRIVKENFNKIVKNARNEVTSNDVAVEITSNDSALGSIAVDVTIPKYYSYTNGVILNSPLKKSIILSGFSNKKKKTSMKNPMNNITGFETSTAEEIHKAINNQTSINEQQKIKEFIVENAMGNLPQNFSTKNISRVKSSGFDNITGQVYISEILVDNYINDNGNVQSGTYHNIQGKIIINGFKKISPTRIIGAAQIDSPFQNNSLLNIHNEDLLRVIKSFVPPYVKNYPGNAEPTKNNVTVILKEKSPEKGQVVVSVSTHKSYTELGEYSTSPAKVDMVITGFKQDYLNTDVINTDKKVTGELANISISQINRPENEDLLKKFIFNNMIINKPKNWTPAIIKKIVYSNESSVAGTLTINSIILSKYVDIDGTEVTKDREFNGPFMISGFMIDSPTIVESTYSIAEDFKGLNVFQVNKNVLMEWLSEKNTVTKKFNWEKIFKKVPSGFKVTPNQRTSDVYIANDDDFKINELTNSITVYFTFKRYVGTSGEVIHQENKYNVSFINFTDSKKSTYITSPTEDQKLRDFNNLSAEEAFNKNFAGSEYDRNENILKDFILRNLIRNSNSTVIKEVSISGFNNRNGYITVSSIIIENWLDNDGRPGTGDKRFDFPMNIYGFKRIESPTKIAKTVIVNPSSRIYSMNVEIITEAIIKGYILDQRSIKEDSPEYKYLIISNLPTIINEGNFSNYVTIDLNRDIQNQTISIEISLSLYYKSDESYSLASSNADRLIQGCFINGFKYTSISWIEKNQALFYSLIGVACFILILIVTIALIVVSKKKIESRQMYHQIVRSSNEEILQREDLNNKLGIGGITINESINRELSGSGSTINDLNILEANLKRTKAQNAKLSKNSKKELKAYKKELKKREKILKELEKEQNINKKLIDVKKDHQMLVHQQPSHQRQWHDKNEFNQHVKTPTPNIKQPVIKRNPNSFGNYHHPNKPNRPQHPNQPHNNGYGRR